MELVGAVGDGKSDLAEMGIDGSNWQFQNTTGPHL